MVLLTHCHPEASCARLSELSPHRLSLLCIVCRLVRSLVLNVNGFRAHVCLQSMETKENGKNKISDDNDGGRSGGGHGGEATCAAAFETCMSSCAGGPEVSLLSWRKVPEPGTCTFVCTAVQHGCTRCVYGCTTKCSQLCSSATAPLAIPHIPRRGARR